VSPKAPVTRFDAAFAARSDDSPPGLIPYFTAGYPAVDSLEALLRCAQDSGCIAAEVGIPFSDPLADARGHRAAVDDRCRHGLDARG